ncbi:hypothetical protein MUP01_04350 [Candidatus Bathyarchaeota archaeon]|nr:hypothetical protein [Candidatus Bathyarchaeota archaeon]
MNIPDELGSELEKELRYISDRIIGEDDLKRKVFFFSASSNVIRRIMSTYFDPQLALMDMVFDVSCNTISERVENLTAEKDTTVELIDGFFEKLAESLTDLADCIHAGKDSYKILEKIATQALTTTGAGYYLYTKGIIKV